MINQAMIFAAGLGKRMYPLTKDKPKPLIKIKNKSILKNNIEKLIQNNFKNIIVNAFYHPEQIMDEIEEFSSVKIILEQERLETGGGLVNAINENYFDKNSPILLLNSDIFWENQNYNSLEKIKNLWNPDKMDMLLCLKNKEEFFGYDGKGDFDLTNNERLPSQICKVEINPFAYTGLQVTKQEIFKNIKKKYFSVKEIIFESLMKQKLFGYIDANPWFHIGTVNALQNFRKDYNE